MNMNDCTKYHVDVSESTAQRPFGAITMQIDNFENFATFKSEKLGQDMRCVRSEEVYIGGLPWRLRVDCVRRSDGPQPYLDMFLYCMAKDVPETFRCYARVNFIVYALGSNTGSDLNYKMFKVFEKKEMAWGCSSLRRVDDLLKPSNGFLHDGALFVGVLLSVAKPCGLTLRNETAGTDKRLDEGEAKSDAQLKEIHNCIVRLGVDFSMERIKIAKNERENKTNQAILKEQVEKLSEQLRKLKEDLESCEKNRKSDSKDMKIELQMIQEKLEEMTMDATKSDSVEDDSSINTDEYDNCE